MKSFWILSFGSAMGIKKIYLFRMSPVPLLAYESCNDAKISIKGRTCVFLFEREREKVGEEIVEMTILKS